MPDKTSTQPPPLSPHSPPPHSQLVRRKRHSSRSHIPSDKVGHHAENKKSLSLFTHRAELNTINRTEQNRIIPYRRRENKSESQKVMAKKTGKAKGCFSKWKVSMISEKQFDKEAEHK